MKVIDLDIYRTRRAILELERKIGQHALAPKIGSVQEIKTCFKEWLRVANYK